MYEHAAMRAVPRLCKADYMEAPRKFACTVAGMLLNVIALIVAPRHFSPMRCLHCDRAGSYPAAVILSGSWSLFRSCIRPLRRYG